MRSSFGDPARVPRRGDAAASSWPWRLAREGRKTRVGKIREDRAAIFGAWAIGAPTRDVRVVHARLESHLLVP